MEQAKRKIFTGCYFRKAVIPVASVMIRRLAILCILNYILVILLELEKEIKFVRPFCHCSDMVLHILQIAYV